MPIQECSFTGPHEGGLTLPWHSHTFQLVYSGLPPSGLTTCKTDTTAARLECYRLQMIAHPMAIGSYHLNQKHRITIRHGELPGLYRQQYGVGNSFIRDSYQRNLPTQESGNVNRHEARLAVCWKRPTVQQREYSGLQSSSLIKREVNSYRTYQRACMAQFHFP